MVAATATLSAEDLDIVRQLIEDFSSGGRLAEATILYKLLLLAEPACTEAASWEGELTAEDIAAVERGETDIATGHVVPYEVVAEGPAAVADFRRRRDAAAAHPPDGLPPVGLPPVVRDG